MALRIDPAELGTLELDGLWVPYIDLFHEEFVPTRLQVLDDEYAFESSIIQKGHSAVMPARIRELRAAGKNPIVVEREDRYYIYVTPP